MRAIAEIEEGLADLIAHRSVEESIERKINAKMIERHQDYLKDLGSKRSAKTADPKRPRRSGSSKNCSRSTSVSSARRRSRSCAHEFSPDRRPRKRDPVALAKIGSPYPQHVILYGPPGVGKTTVARLALGDGEETRRHTISGGRAVRGSERFDAALGSARDDEPAAGQRARSDLSGQPARIRRGRHPRTQARTRDQAHGGVLFIDEIGEMDALLQTKLLKVLEDKRVTFESSYYDPAIPAFRHT